MVTVLEGRADYEGFDTVRKVPPQTKASPADIRRRATIGPLGFSHFGIRSRDIEATRHFYEDVIGLPLIFASKSKKIFDPGIGKTFDMMHFFFELADGSSLGFFGIEKGIMEPHILPDNPLQFHFSVQMENEQAVRDMEPRVRNAGYKCMLMDHGSAFSLYVHDPDGIQFEMCHHRDDWMTDIDEVQARRNVDEWVANGERWA